MTGAETSTPGTAGPEDDRLVGIERALIVVAHPDDVEAHCGGTVLRLTEGGCRVTLVVCTSGDKGTADRSLTPDRLAAMREAEQLVASRILGIATTHFLRLPDGEIADALPTRELRGRIVRIVRETRPDVVITHDPEHPWPPYRAHRDHRAAGRATLDALYPDARDHLFYPKQITEEGLAPHRTPAAWLIMSEIPDWIVDIGAVFERKIAARLAHTSQYTDAAELESAYRRRAATIGALAGVELGEALKVVAFE